MNRSRRRNCNTVNAASLARWIVMTAFLALAGLAYVYLTLQLYHLGERRKAVENELATLHTQNDVAAGQIALLLVSLLATISAIILLPRFARRAVEKYARVTIPAGTRVETTVGTESDARPGN